MWRKGDGGAGVKDQECIVLRTVLSADVVCWPHDVGLAYIKVDHNLHCVEEPTAMPTH